MRIARFALAAAAVITFGAGFVVAQDRGPAAPENAILADVARPAIGAVDYFLARPQGVIKATDSIHLDYQRVVAPSMVLSLLPGYQHLVYAQPGLVFEDREVSFLTALEWHPWTSGLAGFFLGAAAEAVYYEQLGSSTSPTMLYFGAGPAGGWQLFVSDSFLLSISLGLSWGPSFLNGSPVASWNYIGYGMNRFALGLAF